MVLSPENITELFRFGLLLTGDADAAGRTLVVAVGEIPDELMQLRSEKNRTVWLLQKVRELADRAAREPKISGEASPSGTIGAQPDPDLEAFAALQKNLGVGDAPATSPLSPLASIAKLPEPERSALALFYLDLLEPREQAQFFKIGIEELSERIGSARKLLRREERA